MLNGRKFLNKLRSDEHVFYLTPEQIEGSIEAEIWFVNNSDEVLTEVFNSSGGFASVSDDYAASMSTTSEVTKYKDVQPQEAVLIDIYDPILDGDFLLQFGVCVTAPTLGTKEFNSEPQKGRVPSATLHWKPLPAELTDPDQTEAFRAPEEAALGYVKRTGRYLDKLVSLNSGDLRMDYAAKRLAPTGLSLEKKYYRGGSITAFIFSDESGKVIYQTCELTKASEFTKNLKPAT